MKQCKNILVLLLSCFIALTLVINPTKATSSNLITIPNEGLVIKNGIFYGIDKNWFEANYKNQTINGRLELPENVQKVNNDSFTMLFSYDKRNNNCLYSNLDIGTVIINEIDFTKATQLTTIGSQAAMGLPLKGTIDLSNTKVSLIGKSAFSSTLIEEVILPDTLKALGNMNDKSGSVFFSCKNLHTVRLKDTPNHIHFELPKGLEFIGNQTFKECTGFKNKTAITIPASVTVMGNEVFSKSDNITTIYVENLNPKNYNGDAFKGSNYGLNDRLIIFKNSNAKKAFNASGMSTYKNHCTYAFTLNLKDKTEQKLWGQPINVCLDNQNQWYIDSNYTLPAVSPSSEVGYKYYWSYNGKKVKMDTLLMPDSDQLDLKEVSFIQDPTVQFTVDGKIVDSKDTWLELNLSNNKEHTIGVKVTHPLLNDKVYFEYLWHDVHKGRPGPRKDEPDFKTNIWNETLGDHEIIINGDKHQRTTTQTPTISDYKDSYYLLEIFGYEKSNSIFGRGKLFYKSAKTNIGSDNDRTTNTAYIFDVITSDGAIMPQVQLNDLDLTYGYTNASLNANVEEVKNQVHTYQWYKDDQPLLNQNTPTLKLSDQLTIGEHNYTLRVTTTNTLNNDILQQDYPAKVTVNKASSHISIDDSLNKIYDGNQVVNPKVTIQGSTSKPRFEYYEYINNEWVKLEKNPSLAGHYKVIVSIDEDSHYTFANDSKEFTIDKATPLVPIVSDLHLLIGHSLKELKLPDGFSWIDENIIVKDIGTYSYDALFTPNDTRNYDSVNIKLVVQVNLPLSIINHIPLLEAQDVTLKLNDQFNPRDYIKATDKEDGDLTHKVQIIHNVNIHKVGNYQVTYSIIDSMNAIATKTINVFVKDIHINENITPTNDNHSQLAYTILSMISLSCLFILKKKYKS